MAHTTLVAPIANPLAKPAGCIVTGCGRTARDPNTKALAWPAGLMPTAKRTVPSVKPVGIPTGLTLGTVRLAVGINPAGQASALVFGSLAVRPQPVTIQPAGLASGLAIGATRVVWAIRPGGIASGLAFGSVTVTVFLASGRAFRVQHGLRAWDVARGQRTFEIDK